MAEPMAITNLGRVTPGLMDAYSAAVAYEKLDIVQYARNAYIARAGTQGNPPADEAYWMQLTDVETGAAAYVWIRYADQRPESDADMKETPGDWLGIYSGTADAPPTAYTAYTWQLIVAGGEGSGDMRASDYAEETATRSVKNARELGGVVAAQYITLDALEAWYAQKEAAKFEEEHPVGDLLFTGKEGNPQTWLKRGVWERWGKGRVAVGVDEDDPDFATAGLTGGAKAQSHGHTLTMNSGGSGITGGTALTVAQIASHTHEPNDLVWVVANGYNTGAYHMASNAAGTGNTQVYTTLREKNGPRYSGATGGGAAHTHPTPEHVHTGMVESASISLMQPYITCYMWKRTA